VELDAAGKFKAHAAAVVSRINAAVPAIVFASAGGFRLRARNVDAHAAAVAVVQGGGLPGELRAELILRS